MSDCSCESLRRTKMDIKFLEAELMSYRKFYAKSSDTFCAFEVMVRENRPLTHTEVRRLAGLSPQQGWNSIYQLLRRGLIEKADPYRYIVTSQSINDG